jgi:hypothetical protein
MAFYCNPSLPSSILNAIESAIIAPLNVNLQHKILTDYTWPVAALKTLEAYNLALSE